MSSFRACVCPAFIRMSCVHAYVMSLCVCMYVVRSCIMYVCMSCIQTMSGIYSGPLYGKRHFSEYKSQVLK